ncbi:transmembrane protein UsgS [Diplocarpon rosae]|nr:transmembrane protein UsgS [Diplocarpon rosae]
MAQSRSRAQKPLLAHEELKKKLTVSNFDPNAILRGAQLTVVGALRALQNPGLFTSEHYKQAAIAVAAGLAIRILIGIPVIGIKVLLWFLSFVFDFTNATWDDDIVSGLDFVQNYVLQVPFFLMTLMRYVTPTLDNITHSTSTAEAVTMFLMRFGKKAGLSLAVFALSYIPYVGRFVLPAASFYTFNSVAGLGPAAIVFGTGIFLPRKYLVIFLQSYFSSRSLMRELLEPYFSRIKFTKEQKKHWFHDREGLLFGFGVGFYIFLRIPLLGVLVYGIAEASTAYLITKITDPPPPPAQSEGFAASQQTWRNKHEFLNLKLANLDAHTERSNGSSTAVTESPPSTGNSLGIPVGPPPAVPLPNHTIPITVPLFTIMGKTAIRNICEVSLDIPAEQHPKLHNRWHPDVPFAGTIQNGETVKIECVDWTGGQIGNNDSADDVKNVDLTKIHYLSGPFEVETAEPGDVLLVEIMDVQPHQDHPWGFVLNTWNKREGELISANKLDRIVAQPPNPTNVHAGSASGDIKEKVGREGARTIPGRPEHGGNCDIKNLSRGSKVFLPVHVRGAKFSVGDLHFSQGDGEISFCGAIEMSGVITINFKVVKNGMVDLGMKSPIYLPGPVEPHYGPGRYLTFEGFSVDQHGKQHYMDVTVAYRQTILRCIEYLRRFGYSDYQVYLLLSCAPVQGHVAGIVDIPNACTTLGLPMDIFDFDISPTGPAKKLGMGDCAYETGASEGRVTNGGENSDHSFGGGLTFKEKPNLVENLKENVVAP